MDSAGEKQNVGENDPYRGMMERAKDDRRPEFLNRQKGGDEKAGAKAQTALKAGEAAATMAGAGAVGKVASSVAGVKKGESQPSGLYSGSGKPEAKSKKGKFKLGKASAAGFVALIIAILGIAGAFIGSPIFMIGMIDYNLQQSLGFSPTVAIIEKVAEHITGEMLSKGEVPRGYANDLVAAGIDVGQVTASGDFVRTNVYIAGLGEGAEVAATGNYYESSKEGELAVLFEGEVIQAEDFVAAVEANPRMYAAYSEAADIAARFYYSDEVNKIYSDMNLTRHAFHDWEGTGDEKQDKEDFQKILVSILDKDTDVDVNGCKEGDSKCEESFSEPLEGEAQDIIGYVADDTQDSNATSKAAQLLNAAISANEPYKAAAAFMAIEEPIQRARIDGDGPVNEVMNTLSETTVVKYVDVSTNKEVEKEASILETPNFAAAVSDGTFDKNEALSFARDRVMKATGTGGDVINTTIVDTSGQKKASSLVGINFAGTADQSVLDKATDSVSIAVSEKNSELFTSMIGGNRAVEGGSFISNTINARTLGALPSDAAAVAVYSHEVQDAIARKAAAERATLSPFDVSSPNTFMGSIVHSLAAGLVQNRLLTTKNTAVVTSAVNTVARLADDAIGSLNSSAVADGDDQNYLNTFGEACGTANSVGSEADLYCTPTTTITTKYIDRSKEDWDKVINKDEYEKFVLKAMDRAASVGVEDGGVCEKIDDKDLTDVIAGIFGMYDACKGHEDEATGKDLVLTDSNSKRSENETFAGYALYDEVSSLLSESETTAARIKREYYAAHPVDNSEAGRIARISGMSKKEAEIALGYADYLVQIAKYDPSTRYAFGTVIEVPQRDALTEFATETNTELYCFWKGKIEYRDLREKTLVA